ncbi:hypothetical protein GCM10028783_32470 [Modestobacter muralis]
MTDCSTPGTASALQPIAVPTSSPAAGAVAPSSVDGEDGEDGAGAEVVSDPLHAVRTRASAAIEALAQRRGRRVTRRGWTPDRAGVGEDMTVSIPDRVVGRSLRRVKPRRTASIQQGPDYATSS